MRQVAYALIPGIACAFWLFGWGVLINLFLTTLTAVISELLILRMRGRPGLPAISDGSALITALLLGLALPALAPWWIAVIGTAFAIIVAKQLYGGLGFNPFNPAMVGYVVLIISFPKEMTIWAIPSMLTETTISLGQALNIMFLDQIPAAIDSISMATPLDTIKTQLGLSHTISEIKTDPRFSDYGGTGWELLNFFFLLGGIWLLKRRVISWEIPVSMLFALFFMALIFFAVDQDGYVSPVFHLMSGGTMLGAFFIATDPVTASTTRNGRLIYGAGIGVIIYIIRTWGGYPDGVAFAVLLMNMAVPSIDHYTQPRVFGHKEP